MCQGARQVEGGIMEAHTRQEITEQLEDLAAQLRPLEAAIRKTLAEGVSAVTEPAQAKHLAAYVDMWGTASRMATEAIAAASKLVRDRAELPRAFSAESLASIRVTGRMLFAIAVVAFPGTGAAQNNSGGAGTLVAAGTCSELVVGAENYSSSCNGEAASVTLDDGTIMFVFSAGDRMVGFSGDGRAVTGTGVGQAQLPVQFLSIGKSQGDLDEVMPALGICRFGDPYSGPATLECTAKSQLGTISARFVTDGKPPRKG